MPWSLLLEPLTLRFALFHISPDLTPDLTPELTSKFAQKLILFSGEPLYNWDLLWSTTHTSLTDLIHRQQNFNVLRRPKSCQSRQTGPCHLPNELYDNLANRKPRVGPLAKFDGSLQSLGEAEDDALNSADRRLRQPQHSGYKGHSISVAERVGTALDTARTPR